MEEIQVADDGEWKWADDPDWLTTAGVASCIAVGVGHDASARGWLIHAPFFGHNPSEFEAMVQDALAQASNAGGLKVWACGAIPADDSEGCRIEAERAKTAVIEVIGRLLPMCSPTYLWGEGGFVELIFANGGWDFTVQ